MIIIFDFRVTPLNQEIQNPPNFRRRTADNEDIV